MKIKAKPGKVKPVDGAQPESVTQHETANKHPYEGQIDPKQWSEVYNDIRKGACKAVNYITQNCLKPQLPLAQATPAAPEPQLEINRIATESAANDIHVADMINGEDESEAQVVERLHPPSQSEEQPGEPVPPEVIPAEAAGGGSAKPDSAQEGTTPAPTALPPKAADPEIAPTDNEQPPNAGNESPNQETVTPPISAPEVAMDQITIAFGADRGTYSIHPVACMFPLIQGNGYDELVLSIQNDGQLEPCIVDGSTFLDGRNRVRALNQLKQATRVIEFAELHTGLTPSAWVMAKNLQRRHLTNDQRLAIAAQFRVWNKDDAARKQAEANTTKQQAQDVDSDEASPEISENKQEQCIGKSASSEFPPKPAENPAERKRGRPPGERSEVNNLAKETKQTRYRAQQMVRLEKSSPALFKQVVDGSLGLKEATQQLGALQPPKNDHPQDSTDVNKVARAVEKANQMLSNLATKLDAKDQEYFWQKIVDYARNQADLNTAATTE